MPSTLLSPYGLDTPQLSPMNLQINKNNTASKNEDQNDVKQGKRQRQNSIPEVGKKHFKNGFQDDKYAFLQTPSPIKMDEEEMLPLKSSESNTLVPSTLLAKELMPGKFRLEHIWNLFNVISGRLINSESEIPERLISYHRVYGTLSFNLIVQVSETD